MTTNKKEVSVPKYMLVHEQLGKLGEASTGQLAESTGFTKLQITGALVQLERIGAIEKRSRGVWAALEMPEGYPKRRGRPISEESLRSILLNRLSNGNQASLGDLVEEITAESDDAVDKVRARVAHAIVGLRKDGLVKALGERGTYRYVASTRAA